MTTQTIGILLFDDAEELDFVGPFEVFTMLNEAAKKPPEGLTVKPDASAVTDEIGRAHV